MSIIKEGKFIVMKCDFAGDPEKPKTCLSFLAIREDGLEDFLNRARTAGWVWLFQLGPRPNWHICPDHAKTDDECPFHTKEENCDCDK